MRARSMQANAGQLKAGGAKPPVNAKLRFEDPDHLAETMTGGRYGVTPFEHAGFAATFRSTILGDGLVCRSAAFESAFLLRALFLADDKPTISFLLPCISGPRAVLNGKEVDFQYLSTSNGGVHHQIRGAAGHEAGTVCIQREMMLDTYEALTGLEAPSFLHGDSIVRADPKMIRRLNLLHSRAGDIGTTAAQHVRHDEVAATSELRETLLATMVGILSAGEARTDHQATRRQTASMARIDRFIDDHPQDVPKLQDLCRGTGMALRTVESIIRSRTGLTALQYLRRRRLAFARRALANANQQMTVTGVAMEYGFTHLGRFSVDYRKAYGEPPSASLSRALDLRARSPAG